MIGTPWYTPQMMFEPVISIGGPHRCLAHPGTPTDVFEPVILIGGPHR